MNRYEFILVLLGSSWIVFALIVSIICNQISHIQKAVADLQERMRYQEKPVKFTTTASTGFEVLNP